MDDRLVCVAGSSQLLSAKPTLDNEIWPLILEKAFCIHAGGWDKIDGGQPSVALTILTGCTDSFYVMNSNFQKGAPEFKIWQPTGGYKAFKANNPESGPSSLSPAEWFTGGSAAKTADQMFDFLAECDRQNYVVCAGTGAGAHGRLHSNRAYCALGCGRPRVLLVWMVP